MPVAKRQLDAAPIVVREYVSEALGNGEDARRTRVASSVLRELHRYLTADPVGIRVHTVCNINPIEVIRRFADDTRFDQRYREHQLGGMVDEIATGQARDRNRAAMIAAGHGFGR